MGGVINTCENETTVCQTFRVWISISYFLIGGLIHKLHLPRHSGVIILGLFILNIVMEEWLCNYIGNEYCEYFYGSVYVQLLSVFTFMFILNIRIKYTRIVSAISRLFLPVYTVHGFVIIAVFRFLQPYDYWFMALVCWILVSIVSITVSFAIMKIPYMDKIFKI